MTTHLDTGAFVIEEHAGDMYDNGLRFSLDERHRDADGVVRILNIGWYRTLEGARHALDLACGPSHTGDTP